VPEALLASGIRWGALGPLLLVAAAIMGSPRPTTVSLVGVASAFGWRGAVPYMVGEVVGTTAVLVAVATGITAALLALPALSTVLLAVAGLYILWLAYHIATAPPLAARDEGAAAPSFAGGLLLGVANPKAWVAIAAVFASVQLAEPPTTDAVSKTLVLTGMIVLIHVGWLLAGASIAPMLRHPRRARVVNLAMAIALVVATALAFLP
jgi:threonine/homoserine/homoserine lactone efflux protein